MEQQKIYILTHKRYSEQVTWHSLTKYLRSKTELVVVDGEKKHYSGDYPIVETTPGLKGIALTRQWCLEQNNDKILMLDDDLVFAKRRVDYPDKFQAILDVELDLIFERLFTMLDTYAHVGLLAREGGNRLPAGIRECTRAMRFLGYNISVVHKSGCKFTEGLTQDDFDMTLQLLKNGYKNAVLCDAVHNQKSSGAVGGASEYRDIESHNASARRLAELHPGLVTVVTKHTKVAWGGQPRQDVVCQWKKAYDQGKR
jgi:hypothetical protein